GALLGMTNGYILLRIFLPKLPQSLPEPLALLSGRSSATAAGTSQVQVKEALKPLSGLVGGHGSYIILGIVGLIVVWVVSSIQPERRQ
ncbi:MAG: hypothetical protein J7M34_14385, partial [Anaerolineae bacterium]|nr:hypothetical protein [Anaerolineae bacterium]